MDPFLKEEIRQRWHVVVSHRGWPWTAETRKVSEKVGPGAGPSRWRCGRGGGMRGRPRQPWWGQLSEEAEPEAGGWARVWNVYSKGLVLPRADHTPLLGQTDTAPRQFLPHPQRRRRGRGLRRRVRRGGLGCCSLREAWSGTAQTRSTGQKRTGEKFVIFAIHLKRTHLPLICVKVISLKL